MNLLSDFSGLKAPTGVSDNVFNAKTIQDYSFAKIGINIFSFPVILIRSKNDGTFLNCKNIRLKYLELAHNVECKITEMSKNKLDFYSVVVFRSENQNLLRYFLGVSEILIRSLSKEPTQKEILNHFEKFIEVFHSISDSPQKSLQGLWAELFLIAISKSPENLINYWHTNPQEKFDFNAATEKLEVKSSSNLERIHTFSSEQLNPQNNSQIIIASIFTKQNPKGKNIEELIEGIKKKLNSSETEERLYNIISKTLGNSIEQSLKVKYDYEIAINSLRYYDVSNISKIEKINIPYNVTEVRYKSNLSESDFIEHTRLKEYGQFYESI